MQMTGKEVLKLCKENKNFKVWRVHIEIDNWIAERDFSRKTVYVLAESLRQAFYLLEVFHYGYYENAYELRIEDGKPVINEFSGHAFDVYYRIEPKREVSDG